MFFLKGKMPTCFSAWAVAKDGLTAIDAIALLGKLDKSSCWRPELHEFGHQVSWPHAASALSGQLSRSMTIDVLFRAWACKVENESVMEMWVRLCSSHRYHRPWHWRLEGIEDWDHLLFVWGMCCECLKHVQTISAYFRWILTGWNCARDLQSPWPLFGHVSNDSCRMWGHIFLRIWHRHILLLDKGKDSLPQNPTWWFANWHIDEQLDEQYVTWWFSAPTYPPFQISSPVVFPLGQWPPSRPLQPLQPRGTSQRTAAGTATLEMRTSAAGTFWRHRMRHGDDSMGISGS